MSNIESLTVRKEKSTELARTKEKFLQNVEKNFAQNKKLEKDEKLLKYFTAVFMERVDRLASGLSEKDQVAFYESLPSLDSIGFVQNPQHKYMKIRGDFEAMPDALVRGFEAEVLRSKLLIRLFDIEASPNVPPDEMIGYYYSLLPAPGRDQGENNLLYLPDKEVDAFQKACDNDSELFIDLATACADRTTHATPLQNRWKSLAGSSFEHVIGKVLVTEEGFPYRKGHREEDVKLAQERLGLYYQGKKEGPKSYDDLAREVLELGHTLQEQTKENETRAKAIDVLTNKVEKTEDAKKAAEKENDLLKSNWEDEKKERKEAEAELKALRKKLAAVQEIANEKVGLLSKDTRASRIQKMIEGLV